MKRSLLLSLVFLMAAVQVGVGQCAMCKAQIESSEDSIANGINEGILFLMLIPYVLLGALLFVFFNGRIKKSLIRFINS